MVHLHMVVDLIRRIELFAALVAFGTPLLQSFSNCTCALVINLLLSICFWRLALEANVHLQFSQMLASAFFKFTRLLEESSWLSFRRLLFVG
jgi:hypothetical protein